MDIDFKAIRARDAAAAIEYGPATAADRRELLRYVDELREAAGKVMCLQCRGLGDISLYPDEKEMPCPDCTDLRRLLGESHE